MNKKPLTTDQRRKFLPQYKDGIDGLGQITYATMSPRPGDMLVYVPAVNDRVNEVRSYTTQPLSSSEYRPMVYVVLANSKRNELVSCTTEIYIETDWVQLLSVEDDHIFHAKIFDNMLNGYVRLSECGSIDE